MNNYKCPNAIKYIQGLERSIKCKINNEYCCFARYCPTKRDVEHTPMAEKCLNNPERKD